MIRVHRFGCLGRFDNDWLSARYHFSFADYHDPDRMGLGPLRVWNDDTIQPGGGFPMHGHRDMEIVTYVRRGAISHEDHLGNAGRTAAGEVQVMSAGRGILHAEFNREPETTQLFQIWIEPRTAGGRPRWATRPFPAGAGAGQLVPLASGRAGRGEALEIGQDATLYAATLPAGTTVRHALEPGRRAYLVPARGMVAVNDATLGARDGAAVIDEDELVIEAREEESEIVLVDLP